ncbi:MAG: hypothetical protein C4542_05595 [Dehalococcoidia bacterium]|nr:MAG: hypothetical protein C4542_05595 [Dehalococcoidia bacterium]
MYSCPFFCFFSKFVQTIWFTCTGLLSSTTMQDKKQTNPTPGVKAGGFLFLNKTPAQALKKQACIKEPQPLRATPGGFHTNNPFRGKITAILC